MSERVPRDYQLLLVEVKQRIRSAQYEALRAVNRELISLYWDIGRIIAERQRDEGWGRSVVEQLAEDLRKEFPGIKGFSARNIWYMRSFYLVYGENPKLQPMVAEIGWTHNIIVMERCKDDLEREFYIRMTRKFGWSKSVLIHQIENRSYEKTMASQTNFDQACRRRSALRQSWRSETNTLSIFWNSGRSTASASWSGRCWRESRLSCARWAGCSPLWAANTGWRSARENTSSICCSSTAV